MEVVLRTVNELMAGRVKKKGDVSGIYNVFENSDWKAIIKEIVKLPFKKVEDDTKKSIDPGSNQRKLIPQNIDFLKIFNIDLGNVMPSDEDIDKIRQKLG
ncbi:MAG: hypothetical protein HY225_02595 [Candidatus Vogelbacteria bacterium]|nr:hypothetical protein [Candidatus Vogelbacteria bacterium]